MSRAFTKKPASEPVQADDGDAADGAPSALTPEQLWGRILAWQARREHSRAELSEKLHRLGADSAQAEVLLDRLAELGLQSDDRYAGMLVRSQLQRGRGQRAIRQVLQQRGIAPDHPALAEQAAALDWVARARELLIRRFGQALSPAPADKARQVRFLQYRGFSLSQALAAIAAVNSGSEGEG